MHLCDQRVTGPSRIVGPKLSLDARKRRPQRWPVELVNLEVLRREGCKSLQSTWSQNIIRIESTCVTYLLPTESPLFTSHPMPCRYEASSYGTTPLMAAAPLSFTPARNVS